MQDRLPSSIFLKSTAVAAMVWVVIRASVQAVTIDEAMTFRNFAASPDPTHWGAHGNNHILNTLLMRLFISIFGPSPAMVRAGAIIGAAVYVYAALRLAGMIARGAGLRWALFACLIFNPLVFDFMVAARGYGLALAFLTLMIEVAATEQYVKGPKQDSRLIGICAACSICAGMSISANFAFSFVVAAVGLMLCIWMVSGTPRRSGRLEALASRSRLVAAWLLPGALVAGVVAASAIGHWRDLELVYGAQSLRETLDSLAEASLYEPNPNLVAPAIYNLVVWVSRWILPLLGASFAIRLGILLFNRPSMQEPHTRWLLSLGLVIAGGTVLAICMHAVVHIGFHVLWPKDRTAIYVVTLSTLLAGTLAAVPVPSRAGTLSQSCLTGALFLLAGYFLLTMRLSYFKEWKWDSDVDKVYDVLAYYNHTCGVRDVPVNWRYDAALNYYRIASRRETLLNFASVRAYPSGKYLYVLYNAEDQAFIVQNGLSVVYESPSGAVVALDPQQPAVPGHQQCEIVSPEMGIRP